jgi:hypothetical protein
LHARLVIQLGHLVGDLVGEIGIDLGIGHLFVSTSGARRSVWFDFIKNGGHRHGSASEWR